MGKYIELYEIEDLNRYCKSRCKKIITEYSSSNINYYRGQYKGYSYGITVTQRITKKNMMITHVKLYNHFKDTKKDILGKYITDKDFKAGLLDSIYDLLNYVSMLKG